MCSKLANKQSKKERNKPNSCTQALQLRFNSIISELYKQETQNQTGDSEPKCLKKFKMEGEQKWEEQLHCEDDEALSLCDLPVSEGDKGGVGENVEEENRCLELQDFEFGSWGGNGSGSVLVESEMCAADDVFFQGQLLPLRLSCSSETGLSMTRQETQFGSRSESMYHSSSSAASSSRSQSHHSSSTTTIYKPKLRNNFHSHPSPKPQVWVTGSRSGKNARTRKSTVWGLFRVGLVRTPEIELKRSFNTRSNSSGSESSSYSNGRKSESGSKSDKNKKKTQRFLFESCKCSVDAVEIVPEKIVVVKSRKNGKKENEEEKEKKLRKQALHQRRTVEWLKELSITGLSIEV